MKSFFVAASPAHQKKEKAKARELRQSPWWKQQLGKGVCYHCGERFAPAELTMDHLLPIARGGKSDKKNCVPSCKDCNTKKGHKLNVEITMEAMEGELERLRNSNENEEDPQDEG